jgi:hypothetical protein
MESILRHLIADIAFVNSLLGLRISMPTLQHWDPRSIDAADLQRGDALYLQLLGAILDRPIKPDEDIVNLMERHIEFVDHENDLPLSPAIPYIQELIGLSDEEFLGKVSQTFDTRTLDLSDLMRTDGFVYAKVNHYYWEHVAFAGYQAKGREFYRPFGPHTFGHGPRCRADDLIIATLRRLQRDLKSRGVAAGCFDTNEFSLGVSFNNGDGQMSEDLAGPVYPIMRGAAQGSYGFFKGFFPAPRHVISVGRRRNCSSGKTRCIASSSKS